MSQAWNFGVGTLFGVRTDITTPTPVKFGVLQECDVDIAFTNKDLMGQYQLPVDIARSAQKVTGKAKQAQIYSAFFDLFFGQGVTTANSQLVSLNEPHSVPGSSTYTITVTNSATFLADLGVSYAATGIPLTHVASLTAVGQYTYSAGVYTFYSGDASAAVLISYQYISTNNVELVLANQLQGNGPLFKVVLATTWRGNFLNLTLNQCTSEKLSMPFKNQDFTINEFDFSAMADGSNNWATWSMSQ